MHITVPDQLEPDHEKMSEMKIFSELRYEGTKIIQHTVGNGQKRIHWCQGDALIWEESVLVNDLCENVKQMFKNFGWKGHKDLVQVILFEELHFER